MCLGGCLTFTILLTLGLTVYKVRDPEMTLNSIIIKQNQPQSRGSLRSCWYWSTCPTGPSMRHSMASSERGSRCWIRGRGCVWRTSGRWRSSTSTSAVTRRRSTATSSPRTCCWMSKGAVSSVISGPPRPASRPRSAHRRRPLSSTSISCPCRRRLPWFLTRLPHPLHRPTRTTPTSTTTTTTTSAAVTRCGPCWAPQVTSTLTTSAPAWRPRSDVYSFGVVVTGTEAFCPSTERMLTPLVRPVLKQLAEADTAGERPTATADLVRELVDKRLGAGEYDPAEATAMAGLALGCLREQPSMRPSMTDVMTTMRDRVPSAFSVHEQNQDNRKFNSK